MDDLMLAGCVTSLWELWFAGYWDRLAKRWGLFQVVPAELAETGWLIWGEGEPGPTLLLPKPWLVEFPAIPASLSLPQLHRS